MTLSLLAPQYFGGHRAILLAKAETSAYPLTATSLGDAPSFLTGHVASSGFVGYYDPPEASMQEGGKIGYGAGSPYGLYSLPGVRSVMLNANLRLGGSNAGGSSATFDFLNSFLRIASTTTSPYSLLTQALLIGAYHDGADFYTTMIRYAVGGQIGVSMTEGEGELTASCQLMGLAEDWTATDASSYVDAPAYTAISSTAFGAPLTWMNMISMEQTIGSDTNDFRAQIMGVNFSLNNNLEGKGVRPDTGDDDPISRTHYAIIPHTQTVSGELIFHGPPSTSLYRALTSSTNWNDIVITCDNTDASTGGSAPNTIIFTIKGGRPITRTQQGVDTNAQMSWRLPFVAADLSITQS